MIRQTLIFDGMSVVTDAYRANFAKAKKEYEDSLKELKENFVVNSPMYLEHKKSVELKYKSAVQEARDKHLGEFMDMLENERKKRKNMGNSPGAYGNE